MRSVQTEEDGTSSRNMFSIIFFLIAPAKTCPTSSAMLKSRNIAISASSPISRDVSGTSVDTSLPRRRIIIAIFAEPASADYLLRDFLGLLLSRVSNTDRPLKRNSPPLGIAQVRGSAAMQNLSSQADA